MNKPQIHKPCPFVANRFNKTASGEGNFCKSCNKVVIDFTQKSASEIHLALIENPKSCGIFTENQVSVNRTDNWRTKIWLLSLLSLFGFKTSPLQAQMSTNDRPTENIQKNKVTNKKQNSYSFHQPRKRLFRRQRRLVGKYF